MSNSGWMAVVVMMIPAAGLVQTQIIPRESLQDRQLGWQSPYRFDGVRVPVKVDDKVYSAAQLSMADSFAEWIQASYVPRGGLGRVTVRVSDKLGLYNQNDAAKPQTYGAYAATYTELKYDARKRLVPATSGHLRWTITANALEFGEPLMALNTPTDYYFLLPLFGEAITGSPEETRTRRRYDLSTHPVVGRYITYFNDQMFSSQYSNSSNVLLCRDNTLPFVKVTKGEYLDRLAAAVERKHATEKAADIRAWAAGPARTKIQAATEARYQKRIAALQSARDAHRNRLEEPAQVATLQPDVMLENNPDVFGDSRTPGRRYPVYKVDPAMAALAKSDRPQWVVVTWDGNIATDPVATQLQEAILNNFDFDYLYDFVFNPEKLNGRPYRPRRSPTATEPTPTALRSGFDGRDGEATIETQFPTGYARGTQRVPAVGFSNNKPHNRIRVSITKSGERLLIAIDGARIAEYEKGVPSDLRSNALSFVAGGNVGENDKFYVSNVTIKKE